MLSKVKEAYEEGRKLEDSFSFKERRNAAKQINQAKEPILDLIGAKKDNYLCFLPSKEEVFLKTLYEILMPRAQRSGRNEILIPKGEAEGIKNFLERAKRLGISVKEVEINEKGQVTKELLEKSISKRTIAFFLSWTEVFTGVVHPLFEIAMSCKENEIFLFCDGTDGAGKVFMRYQDLPIDSFMFGYQGITAVCMKNRGVTRGDSWGEDFSLREFFALSAFAKDSLDSMDVSPMEYAMVKNEMIDKVEKEMSEAVFYNKGANYLYDRWCFSFDGVVAENLSYLLREKGIDAEYMGVKAVLDARGVETSSFGALSLTFTLEAPKEKIIQMWDEILKSARKLKEFTYV